MDTLIKATRVSTAGPAHGTKFWGGGREHPPPPPRHEDHLRPMHRRMPEPEMKAGDAQTLKHDAAQQSDPGPAAALASVRAGRKPPPPGHAVEDDPREEHEPHGRQKDSERVPHHRRVLHST